MPTLLVLAGLLVATAAPVAAGPTRTYTTARAVTPPRIDGRLDEAVWDLVPWAGDFVQRDPAEGEPPSAQTEFKILYDDHDLYVAYRAHDPEPERIARILARRDHFPGDWVEINIDSYNDDRTAFSFTASVSGTQGDEFISDDGNDWDSNWDPVWEHEARVDDEGWTAEVRIPLSQLRYAEREEQVWGIQVQRRIYRYEERSTWQEIPKDEDGWVSMFGELRGIRGIHAQRQIEVLPYTLAQTERFERQAGNPFADGSDSKLSGGLDAKVGVTSDLTLDLTVNPDFGQVEADPSVVNLTAFETFFSEKRPFFIEGSNIFDFRLAPSVAFGTHTGDRLFYSRRIGRPPHYRADWFETGYVDQPQFTSIATALKLTGKTSDGLSIGVLESVTSRERALVEHEGMRHEVTVEPLSNYLVGRLQRDFRRGDTRLGGMVTAVHRNIDADEVGFLHDAAYTGGLDFFHYLDRRRYYLALNLVASQVRGSERALLATQTAPARYFQRPGNEGQAVDSTRTRLSGHGGSLRVGRFTGTLNFDVGAAWRSPGLELNDIGYVRNVDEINQFGWVGYNLRNPFSIFRRMHFNWNQWLDFEYGGSLLYQAFNFNTNAVFSNYWNYNLSVTRQNERTSNYELRGGPAIKMPGDVSGEFGVHSDSRRQLAVGAGASATRFDVDAGRSASLWTDVTWRPSNAVRLEVNPSYTHNQPDMQYVTRAGSGDVSRYIYGRLDQKTFDVSVRLEYAVTPTLTVQLYTAPFVSAGRYDRLRRITRPRAAVYSDRYRLLGDAARYDPTDNRIHVDENGDGQDDYVFSRPDFNFRDFNSNLVIRWQYSPGSSIYVVWQQARSDLVADGDFALADDLGGLFDRHPHNILLVKMNYWFSL